MEQATYRHASGGDGGAVKGGAARKDPDGHVPGNSESPRVFFLTGAVRKRNVLAGYRV